MITVTVLVNCPSTGFQILDCAIAGMAGSGKTTLMQRLSTHLHTNQLPGYILNLDPAVTQVPYGANIDIRDTVCKASEGSVIAPRVCSIWHLAHRNSLHAQVNYKNVMKQYSLGPNGGILTSLNLFATRFDQVCCHAPRSLHQMKSSFSLAALRAADHNSFCPCK